MYWIQALVDMRDVAIEIIGLVRGIDVAWVTNDKQVACTFRSEGVESLDTWRIQLESADPRMFVLFLVLYGGFGEGIAYGECASVRSSD